jgi:hypothetical protein
VAVWRLPPHALHSGLPRHDCLVIALHDLVHNVVGSLLADQGAGQIAEEEGLAVGVADRGIDRVDHAEHAPAPWVTNFVALGHDLGDNLMQGDPSGAICSTEEEAAGVLATDFMSSILCVIYLY